MSNKTISTTLPEYMSVAQLAAYTGISASTWNKRRVRGDGPVYSKVGRTVLYRRPVVDNWLAQHAILSTSEQP